MKKNCLTCRYEPEWKKHSACKEHGECKFPLPKLKCSAFVIINRIIYRIKDGEGDHFITGIENCGAWEAKEEK